MASSSGDSSGAHPDQTDFKFGCISLPVRRFDRSIALPYRIQPGLSLTSALPVELSDWWAGVLGSSEAENISKCFLWITAKESSNSLGILDAENRKLLNESFWFLRSFLLSGPTELIEQPYMATGASSAQKADVRQVSRLDASLFGAGMPSDIVDDERVSRAKSIHAVLRPLYETKTHSRLKRAIQAFEDGTKQQGLGQRLHDFVRAVDGVMKLPRGKSRKLFVNRAGQICGDCFESDAGMLYDLRSVDEHLHPLNAALDAIDVKTALIESHRLTAAAETFARSLLSRVLLSPDVLAHYEKDSGIDQLWTAGPAVLSQLTHPLLDVYDRIDLPSIEQQAMQEVSSGFTLDDV